jgi:polysaccharide pyruvyl transferase WcaK-like protein
MEFAVPMKRITVLGNFSGRNAGDNAILGNLLDDVSGLYPDVEFLVPTLNAAYVRKTFGHHRVRAYGLMPWNGALKIFGLPTFYTMLNTDLVLVTDNILFDRDFFNPTFNYLSTIALVAPFCRRRNIPIILYNASCGPVDTPRGVAALRRVLNTGPFAIIRDQGSKRLITKHGIMDESQVVIAADCALNTVPPPDARIDEIVAGLGFTNGKPMVGMNVNAYIGSWSGSGTVARQQFTRMMAGAFDRIIEELDVNGVFFVTQVMDHSITNEVQQSMRHRDRIATVANPVLDYREIAGLMTRLELVIGMRTHALILSTSVSTPVVSINAYPKTLAYLETLDMHRWSIEFADLNETSLFELVRAAWAERAATRKLLDLAVPKEKTKAKASASMLGPLLGLASG